MKFNALIFIFVFSLTTMASDYQDYQSLDSDSKVEVLWSQYLDHELDPIDFFQKSSELESSISINSKIRLGVIQKSFSKNKVTKKINVSDITYSEALKLASNWIYYGSIDIVLDDQANILFEKAKKYIQEINQYTQPSVDEIKDLLFNGVNLSDYSQGEYLTKLFLFCRKDRRYPCRFVLLDRFEKLVREDSLVWSMPALAKSSRDFPYYITNGQTPTGVHSMDSVMPEANRQDAFGKFRRVMLDWIPKGKTIELLPSISHDKKWWKHASLARNNGRKYLRIHGTGQINTDLDSNYYPHVPTAGCISTREGTYGQTTFTDQRIVLDKLMQAQSLLPSYENEESIKGILYVVEIDDEKRAVSLADLEKFDIK